MLLISFSNVIRISEAPGPAASHRQPMRRSTIPAAEKVAAGAVALEGQVVEAADAMAVPDRIISPIRMSGTATRAVTPSCHCPPAAAMRVAARRRTRRPRDAAMDAAQDPPAAGDRKEEPVELPEEMAGMQPSRRYRVPLVVVCRRPLVAAVWWLGPSCRCLCRRRMHNSRCNNSNSNNICNCNSRMLQCRRNSSRKRSTRRKVCSSECPFPE